MLSIDIIAVGKLKNDPLLDVFEDYRKRLQWKLSLTELDDRHQTGMHERLMEKVDPSASLIVMDERGKTLSSRDFASNLEKIASTGQSRIQFMIGGADGLSDDIRSKANLMISFGKQTWPHMLARVMLMEQIYRAQQILAGHPYHRD